MSFRVGQEVVCVDDSGTIMVRKGAIYIVADVYMPYLRLEGVYDGVTPPTVKQGMRATRFRPVVERKTDISVFTEMLTSKKASIPA